MSDKNALWFENAGRKLDPGLVEQLRFNKQQDPSETGDHSISVIVYLNKHSDTEQKHDFVTSCHAEKNNSIGNELGLEDTLYGQLTPKMVKKMKDHGSVDRIFYDRDVKAFLDVATKGVGATKVQEQLGFTGDDVTVAVIDTGIHPHPDLIESENRIIAFKDFIQDQTDPYDDNGHGTHCAGDVASSGSQSDKKYMGPAPKASLVGVKVLNKDGGGKLSTIVKGIVWCIDHKDEYNIRVLSLSLGAEAFESFREDPLSQTVQKAWHHGMVVCAAAGNDGPESQTISTPAINPFVMTVGSTDDHNTPKRSDDIIADYSSRGPTIDSLIKPDIYAPGTKITSLLAPESTLAAEQQQHQMVNESYISLSGTSMATPIVAGVVALMLEANSALSPNDVKSILQATAPSELDDLWGYMNAEEAVDMAQRYSQIQLVTK
ncbi:serine protease AprX [Barrientosiimonas marina]|uniref:S8 family peptidase n=1 Tax=Lentibacillus kimchii TaxID=1542911 RepID=A0ABW2UVV5_9BACI